MPPPRGLALDLPPLPPIVAVTLCRAPAFVGSSGGLLNAGGFSLLGVPPGALATESASSYDESPQYCSAPPPTPVLAPRTASSSWSWLDGGGASCSSSSLRRVQQLLLAQRVRPIGLRGSKAIAAAASSLCRGSLQLPADCLRPPCRCCQLEALHATQRRSHAAASLRLPDGRCQRMARSCAHKCLQQRSPLLSCVVTRGAHLRTAPNFTAPCARCRWSGNSRSAH